MIAAGENNRRNPPSGPWLKISIYINSPTATVGIARRVFRRSSISLLKRKFDAASAIPMGMPINEASNVLLSEKRREAKAIAVTSLSAERIRRIASENACPRSFKQSLPAGECRLE